MVVLNLNWLLHQTATKIAYHATLISDISQDSGQRTQSQYRIWNDFIGLVILSLYSSIFLNVEDYKTENRTHIDVKCEWEKIAAASVSTSSHYPLLWHARIGGEWCWTYYSYQFKLFGEWDYAFFLYQGTFLCVWHRSFLLISYDTDIVCTLYLGVPYLLIFQFEPVFCSPEIRLGLAAAAEYWWVFLYFMVPHKELSVGLFTTSMWLGTICLHLLSFVCCLALFAESTTTWRWVCSFLSLKFYQQELITMA